MFNIETIENIDYLPNNKSSVSVIICSCSSNTKNFDCFNFEFWMTLKSSNRFSFESTKIALIQCHQVTINYAFLYFSHLICLFLCFSYLFCSLHICNRFTLTQESRKQITTFKVGIWYTTIENVWKKKKKLVQCLTHTCKNGILLSYIIIYRLNN